MSWIHVHSRRWGLIAFLLIFAGALSIQVLGTWQDSPTRDEPSHAVDGLAIWQLGTFQFNIPHPPLAKLGSGAVMYFLGARVKTDAPGWVYRNTERVNQQVMLNRPWTELQRWVFYSRLPVIIFWCGLIFLVWWWVRRTWGEIPALAATAVLAFDPSLLGHGHLMNTDVPLTAMFFATIIAADRYWRRPTLKRLAILGLIFGLAQVTKFSAVILYPLIGGLGLIRIYIQRPSFTWAKWWQMIAGIIVMTSAVLMITYRFEIIRLPNTPTKNPVIRVLRQWHAPVPALSYFRGLNYVLRHNTAGHRSVFLGQVDQFGNWRYFPYTVILKTPLPTLALWLVGIISGAWLIIKRRIKITFRLLTFIIPAVAFMTVAMSSNLNLGIRHILPIAPFLALVVGWVVSLWPSRKIWTYATLIAALTVIPVATSAYPHTMGYFNVLAGGTKNGYKYFLDSNLDWSQDVWRLRQYLDQQKFSSVAVKIFGSIPANTAYPEAVSFPTTAKINAGQAQPPQAIVLSAIPLYSPDSEYNWVLSMNRYIPTKLIGSSIYVFDFRLPAS